MGQSATLRNMIQQGQIGAQQLQQQTLATQQMQQDQQDQQTMRQALLDSKGDRDKFLDAITGKVSPKTQFTIEQSLLNRRKELAQTNEVELKNQIQNYGMLRGHLQNAIAAPPDQKQAIWTQAIQDAKSQNLLKPGTPPPPDIYPGDEAATLVANGYAMDTELHKEAHDNQVAQATKTRADAAAAQAKVQGDKWTAEQGGVISESAWKQASTAANPLAAAAATGNKDSYARAWYSLQGQNPKLAGLFPHPDNYDPNTTPDVVRHLGMTSEQQAQEVQRKAAETETQNFHKQEIGIRGGELNVQQGRLALEQGREARLSAGGELTPNGRGVQARFDRKELDAADKQYQQIVDRRSQINDLLQVSDGDTFTLPTGRQVTMDAQQRRQLTTELANKTRVGVNLQNKYGTDSNGSQVEGWDAIPVPPSQKLLDKQKQGITPTPGATPPPTSPTPATPPATAPQAAAPHAAVTPPTSALHTAVQKLNVPISGTSQKGRPIITGKDGKQYEVLSVTNGKAQVMPVTQ
jgi:hypothetical protein